MALGTELLALASKIVALGQTVLMALAYSRKNDLLVPLGKRFQS